MGMPVMRVSEETWKRLQAWAVPLEDTVDDALQRVLDAAEASRAGRVEKRSVQALTSQEQSGPRRRRRRIEKLSQGAYRGPILLALRELGGRGHMHRVLELVFAKVRDQLTAADHEKLSSGTDVRWRNTAAWERFKMVEEGLISADSARGIWELTKAGVAAAEAEHRRTSDVRTGPAR